MDNSNQILSIVNLVGNGILSVLGALCIIISSLLAYVCLTKFSAKSTEIRSILLFSVVHLLTSIIIEILAIYKLSNGYLSFSKGLDACSIFAFLVECLQSVDLISLMILSIMRYLLVCKNTQLKIWIWALILLILTSIPISIYSIGLYNNESKPTPSYLMCTTFPLKSGFPANFSILSIFLLLMPCLLTTIFYFIVINNSFNNLNQMREISHLYKNYPLIESIRLEKLKLIVQFSLVIILLNVNFIPYYIAWLAKYFAGVKLGPIWDCVIQILTLESFCVIPVVVICFQPEIYNEFNLLLLKLRVNFGN